MHSLAEQRSYTIVGIDTAASTASETSTRSENAGARATGIAPDIYCPTCKVPTPTPKPAPTPVPTATPAPTPTPVSLTFSITVPAQTQTRRPRSVARARGRSPLYISQATQSFGMTIAPASGGSQTEYGACVPNANGTSSCTLNLNVTPNQTVTLTGGTYDGVSGQGNQLCYGTTTAYVYANQANNITFDCDPVLNFVEFFLNAPGNNEASSITLTSGTAATFTGTFAPYDIDGLEVSGTIDHYRGPDLSIITINPLIEDASSISVTPSAFANLQSGFTLTGSYSGAPTTGTATLTGAISGTTMLDCNVAPANELCSFNASISFQ